MVKIVDCWCSLKRKLGPNIKYCNLMKYMDVTSKYDM